MLRKHFTRLLQLCAVLFIFGPLRAQRTMPAAYLPGAKVNYVRSWEVVKPERDPNRIATVTPLTDASMTTRYPGRPWTSITDGGKRRIPYHAE